MYCKLICILYALLCGHNFILVKSGCYILPEEFFSDAELTLVSGFASIHFVKYSTATTAKV
jgi:hypothetical protein